MNRWGKWGRRRFKRALAIAPVAMLLGVWYQQHPEIPLGTQSVIGAVVMGGWTLFVEVTSSKPAIRALDKLAVKAARAVSDFRAGRARARSAIAVEKGRQKEGMDNCILSGNYTVEPYQAQGCENCGTLYIEQKSPQSCALWRIPVNDNNKPGIVVHRPPVCSGKPGNAFSFEQVATEVRAKDNGGTILYQVRWRGGPSGAPEVSCRP